ncbi:MAG: response regulator transcription factor [Actinomycetota bacterium]
MTSTRRVLVVDDDPQILKALRAGLAVQGYEVVTAGNGETALDLTAASRVDLVILDLELPGIDGVEVVGRLRGWTQVPVLVLSAHEALDDRVRALDAGADDYLSKPFAMEELGARMRAVMRRTREDESDAPVLRFGELEVDLPRQHVQLNGTQIRLTPTEYRLLEAMVSNAGKLLTHAWLLSRVWGPGYGPESHHYLRIFVRQLRSKLGDDPANPRWIGTEPGLGYRWKAEPGGPETTAASASVPQASTPETPPP